MKHRILVLGAGYAGAYVAGNLARRLSPADIEITVVNAVPDLAPPGRGHEIRQARRPVGRQCEAARSLVARWCHRGVGHRCVTGRLAGLRVAVGANAWFLSALFS